jgi:hypothetical protein
VVGAAWCSSARYTRCQNTGGDENRQQPVERTWFEQESGEYPSSLAGRLTVGMQQRRVKHHLERVERVVGRERELGREHAALLAVSLPSYS